MRIASGTALSHFRGMTIDLNDVSSATNRVRNDFNSIYIEKLMKYMRAKKQVYNGAEALSIMCQHSLQPIRRGNARGADQPDADVLAWH